MEFNGYSATRGMERSATQDEIKLAYHKLARRARTTMTESRSTWKTPIAAFSARFLCVSQRTMHRST